MATLIQMDFPYEGPFGAEMATAMSDLAKSILDEPGFIWKIWTEKESEQIAGGIYLFESEETAKAYLSKHTKRLKDLGVQQINAKILDVNDELSSIDKGPT